MDPQTLQLLQQILVFTLVTSMMISVGLDLTWQRVVEVFRHPLILFQGWGVNYLAVPAVGLAACAIFSLPEAISLGVLMATASPGGPFGAMLTQRARGHLAASVSLVVTMALMNVFMTPLILCGLSATSSGDLRVPVGAMVGMVMGINVLPISIGMALRAWRECTAKKIQPIANMITNVAFTVLLLAMVIFRSEQAFSIGWRALVVLEICVAASIVLGWAMANQKSETRVAYAVSNPIRNLGVALMLATTWFPGTQTDLTIMTWGLVSFANAIPVSMWFRRRRAHLEDVQPDGMDVAKSPVTA